MRTGRLAALLGTTLLIGCSLLISDKDLGRPCDPDGSCPGILVCVEGACADPTTTDGGGGGNDGGGGTACDPAGTPEEIATACGCDADALTACRADGICLCVVARGTIDGLTPAPAAGRNRVTGATLGIVNCAAQQGDYLLCGGLTQ